MSQLADRLGHPTVLIVSADLLGSCHASVDGVYQSLRRGVATTATLPVPCPWVRHAASQFRGDDVGVQLMLNSPHDTLRWGPITQAPSLLDGDGGFPRTPADLWDHADIEEVRRECRAQIERAVLWGFDLTHLTTHLEALQQRPEFFDVYLEMGCEFDLPLRLEGTQAHDRAGFPFRDLAADEGIAMPDRVEWAPSDRHEFIDLVAQLPPGVTELRLEPALDSDELRAADPAWARRVEAHAMLTDPATISAVAATGVTLMGYAAVRDHQRSSR